MKTNIQTLRTNKVKKAKMKLSKHRELGIESKIDIHEVATLMDTLKDRSSVENEALLFSINMNQWSITPDPISMSPLYHAAN